MAKKQANTKELSSEVDIDHYPPPLKALVKEWHVIKGAPVSFIVCSLLVGALIWIVLDRLYAAEIRAKDATIQTLSLRPESTTQPHEELQRLNNELKELRAKEANRATVEWPPLTTEQVEQWRQALEKHRIESIALLWTHSEGSLLYASVAQVMEGRNCKLTHEGGSSGGPDFLIYAAPDDPAGEVILKLLNQSGYRSKMDNQAINWNQWRKDGNAQITIFVGSKH